MSVTISDIAKQLGTSNATVSRALRGDPKVALATRKRNDGQLADVIEQVLFARLETPAPPP